MATKSPATGSATSAPDKSGLERETPSQFPLVKTNFILMAVAAVMIVVGFALTAGGASADPAEFSEEIFSVRRIVVGPNIAFLGFIFMGVGIMWPCKKK